MASASRPRRVEPSLALEEAFGQARLALRQIGAPRLAATLACILIALGCALLSWRAPLLSAAERALYDLRVVVTAPRVDQDPRVVLVVFNDDTLRNTRRRSPLDRGLLAKALTQIDALSPRAIGVDILIDEPQPEDDQLVGALRSMKTTTRLAFASNAYNPDDEQTWQEAYERAFQARLAGSLASAASIRVDREDNGVVRRWPSHLAGEPPLLAVGMAPREPRFDAYRGGLRFRLPKFGDRPLYAEFPIDLFSQASTAALFRRFVAGRYVLVGADISDIDRVGNPATALNLDRAPAGLKIHADLLTQMLDRAVQTPIPAWALAMSAVIIVACGAWAGVGRLGPIGSPASLAAQMLFISVAPLACQAAGFDSGQIGQFGWAIGWLIAYFATATTARSVGSDQRRYAQSALGKYLPKDVADRILKDPSQMVVRGERREIQVLFSDLEGFTEMSHDLEPELVAALLNGYLNLLSQAVLEHGGVIDKFVGDAVVAFWGAPIASPNDAERSFRAAIAMWRIGETFRTSPAPGHPALGRTRVGIFRGPAIVGNFGGEARFTYTAIGDVMNTASRLESANKSLCTAILIGREALPQAMTGEVRPMGRIRLRGRSTPVEVFEAAPNFPADARDRLSLAFSRFEAGELDALDDLRSLVQAFPRDEALAHLLRRLTEVGPRGVYALG